MASRRTRWGWASSLLQPGTQPASPRLRKGANHLKNCLRKCKISAAAYVTTVAES